MTGAFVIDASVALSWVHPKQATPGSDLLLAKVADGIQLITPTLWFLEVANALLVLERRKKLTESEREEALRKLVQLNVLADSEGLIAAFTRTSTLAALNGLSVYDACYLELCIRRQLPLATRDVNLRDAARNNGVELLNVE